MIDNTRTHRDPLDEGDVVTPSDLLAQNVMGGKLRGLARARRSLQLRDLVVATVGADPASVTPLCAISSREVPVVDTLAAIAAGDPSGVLVLESSTAAFAFAVKRGRIVGAHGTGARGELGAWISERGRLDGDDAALLPSAPAWIELARTFVAEHLLDQLALTHEPGARLTLVRGDVEWIGACLPEAHGPMLRHLLLEHARRSDETPRIMLALGSLARVPTPIDAPGERPMTSGTPSAASDEWDFSDDPDPAADAEWDDAVRVWALCDGSSTIAAIVEQARLGTFRTLLALHTLVKARHVALPALASVAAASPADPLLAVILPDAAPMFADEQGTIAANSGPAASGTRWPIAGARNSGPPAANDGPDTRASATAYSYVLRRLPPRPERVVEPERTPVTAEPSASSASTRRELVVDPNGLAATRQEPIVAGLDAPARVVRAARPRPARLFAIATTHVLTCAIAVATAAAVMATVW